MSSEGSSEQPVAQPKVLGNLERGLLFIVSAPAGTGKNTLVNRLLSEFSEIRESISCTTRAPREGEEDGDHYHFLSEEAFLQKVEQGHFLEHVELFGARYGTLREHVDQQRAKGLHVVLVIDTQGALELMQREDGIFIFIRPPSVAELQRRLEARRTEASRDMKERLAEAQRELAVANRYDYQITNDELDVAYDVLKSIFIAEEHRVRSGQVS